jgi:hypothetical protein
LGGFVARLVRIQLTVREYSVDLETLQRLSALAGEIAQISGRENFKIPVEVDLDVGEGSLKVGSVVLGLLSAYYFVGNYKAFKEGIVEICHDANKYGDDFCDRFLQQVGIKKSQVSRKKVEVQAPEQLRNLLDELEALDDPLTLTELNVPVLKVGSRYVRLALARSRLDQILSTLDVEDREAVSGSLVFKSLPPYTQWPRESQLPAPLRYALRPERPKLSRGERAADEFAPVRKRRPKLHVKSKVFVEPRAKRAPLRDS